MADTAKTGGNAQDAPANGGNGTGSAPAAPSGTTPKQEELNNGEPAADTAPKYTEAQAKKLRDEAAASRVELKKATDRLKEIDDAAKTETQKAQETATAEKQRADTLQAQIDAITRKDAITAAVKNISVYPDFIADKITAADVPNDPATGKPDAKLLNAKIAELRTLYPALFKPADQAQDAGAGGAGGTGGGDMNGLIRQGFGRR